MRDHYTATPLSRATCLRRLPGRVLTPLTTASSTLPFTYNMTRSSFLLSIGLVALTCASPVPQTDEPPLYCPTLDLNDAEAVLDLWEGDLMIGPGLRIAIQNYGADGWLSSLTEDVLAGVGNAGISVRICGQRYAASSAATVLILSLLSGLRHPNCKLQPGCQLRGVGREGTRQRIREYFERCRPLGLRSLLHQISADAS